MGANVLLDAMPGVFKYVGEPVGRSTNRGGVTVASVPLVCVTCASTTDARRTMVATMAMRDVVDGFMLSPLNDRY